MHHETQLWPIARISTPRPLQHFATVTLAQRKGGWRRLGPGFTSNLTTMTDAIQRSESESGPEGNSATTGSRRKPRVPWRHAVRISGSTKMRTAYRNFPFLRMSPAFGLLSSIRSWYAKPGPVRWTSALERASKADALANERRSSDAGTPATTFQLVNAACPLFVVHFHLTVYQAWSASGLQSPHVFTRRTST